MAGSRATDLMKLLVLLCFDTQECSGHFVQLPEACDSCVQKDCCTNECPWLVCCFCPSSLCAQHNPDFEWTLESQDWNDPQTCCYCWRAVQYCPVLVNYPNILSFRQAPINVYIDSDSLTVFTSLILPASVCHHTILTSQTLNKFSQPAQLLLCSKDIFFSLNLNQPDLEAFTHQDLFLESSVDNN